MARKGDDFERYSLQNLLNWQYFCIEAIFNISLTVIRYINDSVWNGSKEKERYELTENDLNDVINFR